MYLPLVVRQGRRGNKGVALRSKLIFRLADKCASVGLTHTALLVFSRALLLVFTRQKYKILLNYSCSKYFYFVKIILTENANFGLALRKRLFCNAKPTLLPCKTAAFGMQNDRFCNVLIARWLCNSYTCEKYLHFYRLFSVYKTRNRSEVKWWWNVMKRLRVMRSERLFTADIEQIKSYVLLFVGSLKKLDIWANDCLLQWAARIKF